MIEQHCEGDIRDIEGPLASGCTARQSSWFRSTCIAVTTCNGRQQKAHVWSSRGKPYPREGIMNRAVGIECSGLVEIKQRSSGESVCEDLSIGSVRMMHAFIHLPTRTALDFRNTILGKGAVCLPTRACKQTLALHHVFGVPTL